MRAWLVVAVFVAWIPVARARDGIVLESYEGERPKNADKLLEPLVNELAARGFDGGNSVGRLYEGKVSRPRQNSLPADFAKQLKAGQQEYIRGNYAAAVAALQPLIDTAHDNSGAFAKNQALRQTMLDGLVALALAQDRNGDPKTARLTFEELARSFPGAPVPAATWGAGAAKQFADVERDLKQQAQGRLYVKAPNNAEVYVNERLEQTGNVVKNLIPGEYRVFAREGAKQSRTYRVRVNSTVDAVVNIDLDLDAAVHTSPGWVGLEYASGDRERFEAKHASTFAISIEEKAVVVVGIDTTNNVIFGALVSLSGRNERRASIPLTAGDGSKKQLAGFLAGDAASSEINVLLGPGAPGNTKIDESTGGVVVVPPSREPSSRRWGGWPIVTGIATLGAVAAGAVFYSIDHECTVPGMEPCAFFKDRKPQMYVSIGAGAVLAGLTIYLIVTRPSSAPTKSAYIVPTSDGAMAGVSVRF